MSALGSDYREALARYLLRRDEEALSLAYELGRRALAAGLGLLDAAQVHQEAARAAAPADPALADAFLGDFLSPYEMALRGYRQANQDLQEANRELQRQKEAVEAANRDLESFSYSASHDLRGPLNVIGGYCQLLQEVNAAQLDAEGRRHLATIGAAVDQMAGLIDGLLSLSKLTRGALKRGRVDLSALALRVAARLREADRGREAEFVIAPDLEAEGEPALLGALLENLLGNAWKFSSKRERARIEFGRAPGGGFFVSDNGAGFDMAQAERLFQPFQRLHRQQDFAGHGIGLATVQRVVQWHGGRIRAEGRPGEGATFFFTLDAAGVPA